MTGYAPSACFAITADDFAMGAYTRAKSSRRKLRAPFTRTSAKTAPRNNQSTDGDGMIAGLLIDSVFSVICPGLGGLFNGLSALDAVDLYDESCKALGPSATAQARRNRAVMAPAPRPVSSFRQLLSLVFG